MKLKENIRKNINDYYVIFRIKDYVLVQVLFMAIQ